MFRRGNNGANDLEYRYGLIRGDQQPPNQPTPPTRGDAKLRNRLAMQIGYHKGISGNPDKKAYAKLDHSTFMHRVFGGITIASGIALGIHQQTETPSFDRTAQYELGIMAGSTTLAGLNRFRALKGARRQVVKVHPQELRKLPEYNTDVVSRISDFHATSQGVLHATSVALEGAGALLLTSSVDGGSVAGISDPKVQAIAGGASMLVGLAYTALDGVVSTKIGDSVAGWMSSAAEEHNRAQRR